MVRHFFQRCSMSIDNWWQGRFVTTVLGSEMKVSRVKFSACVCVCAYGCLFKTEAIFNCNSHSHN